MSVCLALNSARANGRPAQAVGNVLRGDGVQQLGGGGHAEIEHFPQKFTGNPQARRNLVGAVQVRVHDQPFPAGGGAGFLEIHAHKNEKSIAQFIGHGLKFLGIIAAGFQVMDGTGPHHEDQARIFAMNDSVNLLASLRHELDLFLCTRKLSRQLSRTG